jgi:hypothetical protein
MISGIIYGELMEVWRRGRELVEAENGFRMV